MRLRSLEYCSSSNGESRTESDVLCGTTIVGDASRGEELALVPRSALTGSNTAGLSVSAKIFTLDACDVQMMLATMILCTATCTTKNYIYYTLQTSGCSDQEVEMVVHHVTSCSHHTEHAAIATSKALMFIPTSCIDEAMKINSQFQSVSGSDAADLKNNHTNHVI